MDPGKPEYFKFLIGSKIDPDRFLHFSKFFLIMIIKTFKINKFLLKFLILLYNLRKKYNQKFYKYFKEDR